MSKVFAFNVSQPMHVDAAHRAAVEGYDPQAQRLVWSGQSEASLGRAVCTVGCCGVYRACISHQTWCDYRTGDMTCGCFGGWDGFVCDYA